MSRSHLVTALVLAVVLSLTAQSASAAPHQPGAASGSAWPLLAQLWSSFTASWFDVGCIIDPYGGCGAAQAPAPPPLAEVGCIADPYGGCDAAQAPVPPPAAEVGCWIDPYGGCGAGH